MSEKDIIRKFIAAHSTLPTNADECAKLISDRDWFIEHFPESTFNNSLNKYVDEIKRIFLEFDCIKDIFIQNIERSID